MACTSLHASVITASRKDVTTAVLLMTPITISIALLVSAVLIAVAYVAIDEQA